MLVHYYETKLPTLFGVHQFSTNVLFLAQHPVQASRLHLVVISPKSHLVYDSFFKYTFIRHQLSPDVH